MNVPNMPYLNASIDSAISALDNVMIVASEFMKDTSFPLEERWNVYLKVEKYLPIRSYFGEAIRKLTDDVYEDHFPDGRGIRWNSDIDESLVENHEWLKDMDPSEDDEWTKKARIHETETWAKRDTWREAVLQEQQGLIVFDW